MVEAVLVVPDRIATGPIPPNNAPGASASILEWAKQHFDTDQRSSKGVQNGQSDPGQIGPNVTRGNDEHSSALCLPDRW